MKQIVGVFVVDASHSNLSAGSIAGSGRTAHSENVLVVKLVRRHWGCGKPRAPVIVGVLAHGRSI